MNRKINLIVIDDDEFDRLHLKRALKSSGFDYDLVECENTTMAMSQILSNSFDCIFLDYLLPGDNGLQFLRKIREAGIKTPIVIITSQGNESIAVELMKAGASDYVIKNEIGGSSLNQIIRSAIRMRLIEMEREEAEKALKVSEARLAEAQRIAKTGNWELNVKNNSFYWSEEVYKIFEIDPETLPTSETFLSHIHTDDLESVITKTKECLKGKRFDIDFRILTGSGIKYINSQGYAHLDSANTATKIIGTYQDITQRKLSEQEVLKARELAENSMKVREIFLANMSHEIRTPMNAILGFTRLLYNTELTEEQKTYLNSIHFSGENLLVIINDILDFSKIQSGKLTIESCPFNFRKLITEMIGVLKPKADDKGLKLEYKIGRQVPMQVKGDPVRLNQILMNLISNGIKFTESGAVHLSVKLTESKDRDVKIEFCIKDTGIGISENMRSRVFESFEQGAGDITRKYGGTGLGLTIVKSLVDLLKGDIELESVPNEGTTFKVTLPFEEANLEVVQISEEPLTIDQIKILLYETRILVVEDNSINQLLVEKTLQKVGCEIDIANNGVEALKKVQESDYEVILMDVQMPEMDGYQATREIRQLSLPISEIPIIGFTAHALTTEINKCLSAGMNDYISKPFKEDELYLKIISHLEKNFAKVRSFPSPGHIGGHDFKVSGK